MRVLTWQMRFPGSWGVFDRKLRVFDRKLRVFDWKLRSFDRKLGEATCVFHHCISYIIRKTAVSEIKDFSDAHVGCMDPKTMHPAKYLCTFPYMSILTLQKMLAFQGAWA